MLAAFLYTARAFLPGRIAVPLDLLADTGAWKPVAGRRAVVSNHLLSDAVLQFVPWDAQARRAIAARRFPWTNPYEGDGTPLWANPVTALASPFTWPRLAAGVRGWTASVFARLCVGGAGALWLARAMGAAPGPAALSGIAYLASGYSIVWALHPQSAVFAWLPWLAAALLRLSRRITARDSMLAIAAAALATAAGHPETLAFGVAGVLAFVLWSAASDRDRAESLRNAGWATLCAAAGFLLLAAQWVPFLGLVRASWSAAARHAARPGGFRAFAIPGILLPGFLGSPLAGELDLTGAAPGAENFNVRSQAFVGVVALVCVALAARRLAPAFRRGLWLGAGALLLAWRVPPAASGLHAFPLLGLAAPEYASAVFVLFAAAAAGPAIFSAARDSNAPLARKAGAALAAAGALLALAGLAPALRPLQPAIANLAARGVALLRARGHRPADAATYAARFGGYLAAIRWTAFRRVFLPGGCWALAGAALLRRRGRLPLLAAAAVGELLAFGLGYVPAVPAAAVPPDPPTIVAIRRLDPQGVFRMAAAGDEYPADLATAAAVRDARSYDVLASRAEIGALEPCGLDAARASFPPELAPDSFPCLARAGIRWWIARNAPGLRRVGGDPPPGVGLYEIPDAAVPPPPRDGPPEGMRAGILLSSAGLAAAAVLPIAARRRRPR